MRRLTLLAFLMIAVGLAGCRRETTRLPRRVDPGPDVRYDAARRSRPVIIERESPETVDRGRRYGPSDNSDTRGRQRTR